MKPFFTLLLSLFILTLFSCQPEPDAHPKMIIDFLQSEGAIRLTDMSVMATGKRQVDWGDGTSSNFEGSINHTYPKNGPYGITLTAYNSKNKGVKTTKSVIIEDISGTLSVFTTTETEILFVLVESLDLSIRQSFYIRYRYTSAPNCSDVDNANKLKLKAGIYKVSAQNQSGTSKWSGTTQVYSGECNSIRLH